MSQPDRELAFWIQFAEIWKDLAELCEEPARRGECLQRAKTCLSHATLARERLAKAAGAADYQLGGHSTERTAS